MKRVVSALILSALVLTASSGIEGRLDGEILGKVIGVERVRENELPYTIYTVIVYRDSSYTGTAAEAGESTTLWTPGGEQIAFLETVKGPLSTVSFVKGEKVFALYRAAGDRRFVVDKWTVWRRGISSANGTVKERNKLAEADFHLETSLSTPTFRAVVEDSLELFHTWNDVKSLAIPVPDSGRTWRDYGLLCGRSDGTLRAVKERIRAAAGGK